MLIRRLILLFPGLGLYGLSTALMVRANLGLNPWNVLHQGLARSTGYSIGTIIVVVGLILLLAWIPLRQWPGFGTVSNVMLIGVTADASLAVLPTPETLPLRLLALVAAIALNGLATGMYIGAGLGAGPRDGLMTGISARTGCSIRLARTLVEVSALALGWGARRHARPWHGALRRGHRAGDPACAAALPALARGGRRAGGERGQRLAHGRRSAPSFPSPRKDKFALGTAGCKLIEYGFHCVVHCIRSNNTGVRNDFR